MFGTKTIATTILVLSVSACVPTSEQVSYDKQQQLNASYQGQPLSSFINRNALLPVNAFDSEGQRVFIFDVPCASWWYTTPLQNGISGPENFIVNRVKIIGYCQ